MSEQQLIRINDKQYVLDMLPDDIKMLVNYHNMWMNDLNEQKLEVIKTETALRECIRELKGEIAKAEATGQIIAVEDIVEKAGVEQPTT